MTAALNLIIKNENTNEDISFFYLLEVKIDVIQVVKFVFSLLSFPIIV